MIWVAFALKSVLLADNRLGNPDLPLCNHLRKLAASRLLKNSIRRTSGAKARPHFQRHRRWPEGQLYRNTAFFSNLLAILASLELKTSSL